MPSIRAVSEWWPIPPIFDDRSLICPLLWGPRRSVSNGVSEFVRRPSRVRATLAISLGIAIGLSGLAGPLGAASEGIRLSEISRPISPASHNDLSRASIGDLQLNVGPSGEPYSSKALLRAGPVRASSGSLSVNDTLVMSNNTVVPGNFLAADTVGIEDAVYVGRLGEIFAVGFSSVFVINDTSNRIVATIPVTGGPLSLAYDGDNGNLYVVQHSANSLSVINATRNEVVATIVVPPAYASDAEGLDDIVYDSATQELFVTDYAGGSVRVYNATNDTNVANINSIDPTGIACNPSVHEVYVAEDGYLQVISDRENKEIAHGHTGSYPEGVAFVGGEDEVFVANSGSNNVSVISTSSFRTVANISVGTYPLSVLYDPTEGLVFVANSGSNNMSVISEISNKVGSSIETGVDPAAMADDPGKGSIYVGLVDSRMAVYSVSTLRQTALFWIGFSPVAIAYDSAMGELFVASINGVVSVISARTNTIVANIAVGESPDGLVYDAAKGEIFVANQGSDNLSVISDSTNRVSTSIPVATEPSALAYDPQSGEIFVADFSTENVSVVSDLTNSVVATINVGGTPRTLTFDGATDEIFVGLADGMSVLSTLNDTVSQFDIPLGYSAYDPAQGELFATSSTADTQVLVISTSTDRVVANVTVGSYPDGIVYDGGTDQVFVSNFESDNVSVISTRTDGVVAAIPVGSNPFGIAYDGGTGTTYVADEFQGTVSIIDQSIPPPEYPVTFSETGLPMSTSWTVTWEGMPHSSDSTSISASEPNGTYAFTVGSITGYTASPSHGSLDVSGGPATQDISFSPTPGPGQYTVTFSETGLPSNTAWSVEFGGMRAASSSTEISFVASNGSVSFDIGTVPGYVASPPSGTVTVNGATVEESIGFEATSTPSGGNGSPTPTILGLLPIEAYALVAEIAGAVLLGVIGVRLLWSRRRGSPPPEGSVPPTR